MYISPTMMSVQTLFVYKSARYITSIF